MNRLPDLITESKPTATVPTIARLLADATVALTAAGVGTPRLDAEVLLAAACGVDRTGLYVRGHEAVPMRCEQVFRSLVARRCAREPLQYIIGRQEFWSLDFVVTPDVLIPRPETELLVELTLDAVRGRDEITICDVGTGSGCISVALAMELPQAQIWALDLSTAALAIAEQNARRHGVAERIRVLQSDFFAAVGGRRFEVIVSNPPYVRAEDLAALQPELAWEPRSAVVSGPDGLEAMAHLVAQAPAYLGREGWLLMEIGAEQATAAADLARAAGFSCVSVRPDYAGLPRVLSARCEG